MCFLIAVPEGALSYAKWCGGRGDAVKHRVNAREPLTIELQDCIDPRCFDRLYASLTVIPANLFTYRTD